MGYEKGEQTVQGYCAVPERKQGGDPWKSGADEKTEMVFDVVFCDAEGDPEGAQSYEAGKPTESVTQVILKKNKEKYGSREKFAKDRSETE